MALKDPWEPLTRKKVDEHFVDEFNQLVEKHEKAMKSLEAERSFYEQLPDVALPYSVAFGDMSDIYGPHRTIQFSQRHGTSGPVSMELVHALAIAFPPTPMKFIEPENYAGTVVAPEYTHAKGVRSEQSILGWWLTIWDFGHNGPNTTLCWASRFKKELIILQMPMPEPHLVASLHVKRKERMGDWSIAGEELHLNEKAKGGSLVSKSGSGSDKASNHYLVAWLAGSTMDNAEMMGFFTWLKQK